MSEHSPDPSTLNTEITLCYRAGGTYKEELKVHANWQPGEVKREIHNNIIQIRIYAKAIVRRPKDTDVIDDLNWHVIYNGMIYMIEEKREHGSDGYELDLLCIEPVNH